MVKNQNKSIRETGKKRKIIKWIIIIPIGIVIILFTYPRVARFIQKESLRNQLSSKTVAKYKESKEGVVAEHDKQILETRNLLKLNQPVYSASYNTCYTDHDDSGWFAVNYNYKCLIRFVDFFETTLVVERDNTANRSDGSYDYMFYHDYLKESGLPYEDAPIEYLYITTRSANRVDDVMDQWLMPKAVVTYAVSQAAKNSTLISESGSTTLDPNKRYVIISEGIGYFNEDIGCAIGGFLFCDSPLGE